MIPWVLIAAAVVHPSMTHASDRPKFGVGRGVFFDVLNDIRRNAVARQPVSGIKVCEEGSGVGGAKRGEMTSKRIT